MNIYKYVGAGLPEGILGTRAPAQTTLEYLLAVKDKKISADIFNLANSMRKKHLGNGIFLRGIVEFSNSCHNSCLYCGLNKKNKTLQRYRLNKEEILNSVANLAKLNIKTVVLQSGEDNKLDCQWLAEIISEIKKRFAITITLCIGERTFEEYKLFKAKGADRYLLKIETTDKKLYKTLHPDMSFNNRIKCLENLKTLGYQVGSGIIIGLKNQTIKSLANDLLFFKKYDFDMISIGPFIAHYNTKLKKEKSADVMLTLKMIALARIITKDTNIPATTALGSLDRDYRKEALLAGANVIMPNFTPLAYKKLYEIYPNKRCINEEGKTCVPCLEKMAQSIGRFIDYSIGTR